MQFRLADFRSHVGRYFVCILMTTSHGILCGPCLAQPRAAANQLVAANPLDLSPPEVGRQYRLGINVQPVPRGLKVTSISDGSPTLQMWTAADPNQRAQMEVGDVIASVNGQAVRTLPEIRAALDAGNATVGLSVVDVNSGQTRNWFVHPHVLVERANRTQMQWDPSQRPMLFAILIADTNDATIGGGVTRSVEDVAKQLRRRIVEQQLELTMLQGDDCTPEKIVRTLALIPSSPLDSVLVYYFGHGAYDPRYEVGDPSRGHFLDLGAKDLLRSTVWNYMQAAPAKLRLLVTDACNVESSADPDVKFMLEMRVKQVAVTGATNLEWLLLGHQGELDLSAASRGEYAWYSNQDGGYFSNQWLNLGEDFGLRDWAPFLDQIRADTNQFYLQERGKIIDFPGDTPAHTLDQLQAQPTMFPTTFRRQLNRQARSPVDPNLQRMIEAPITVKRPVEP